MPIDSDKSSEADILRLKIYRNTIIAHADACCISSKEFDQIWKNICNIFERLGGALFKIEAENMLSEPLTQDEETYLRQLIEWQSHDNDVKEICHEMWDEMWSGFQNLDHKIQVGFQNLDGKLEQVLQILQPKQEISSTGMLNAGLHDAIRRAQLLLNSLIHKLLL